jgi:hypothetical protein
MFRMPKRKEVRWFTRGEFTTSALVPEGYAPEFDISRAPGPKERRLSDKSSIYTFANAFDDATKDIYNHPGNDYHRDIIAGSIVAWCCTSRLLYCSRNIITGSIIYVVLVFSTVKSFEVLLLLNCMNCSCRFLVGH